MRHAPSVGFPVGRSRFWCLGLGLSGILMALVLGFAWPRLPVWMALSLGVSQAAWWIWVARTVGRDPEGRLLYLGRGGVAPLDGAGWAWADARSEEVLPIATPEVVVDLGARVLLHLAGPRGVPRWAWAEASSSRGDWLALRRALKSTGLG